MIEICNLRKQKPIQPYDIKVDRSSVLGNPFFMENEYQRDIVCDKYKEYFDKKKYEINIPFWSQLKYLENIYKQYGKLRLFCWCSPKRCHAETIRNYVLDKFNE